MDTAAEKLTRLLGLQSIDVTREQVAQLAWLSQELLRWNRSRNLTAITDLDEVLEKHIIDSLTLLPHLRQVRRLLDIGSGAGFPVLPLKIACPPLEAVSVDAVAKKIAFQKHVIRSLGLSHCSPLHGRLEQLTGTPALGEGYDLVTARAVGPLALLVKLAEPCLANGGRLIAMKGPEGATELAQERPQLLRQGWTVSQESFCLQKSGARRCLLILGREKHDTQHIVV